MRKLIRDPFEAAAQTGRKPPLLRWLPLILVAAIAAPVLYESALLCLANWQGLVGSYPEYETPVLDRLGGAFGLGLRIVSRKLSSYVKDVPWQPSMVIVLGGALAFALCIPMRGHRR